MKKALSLILAAVLLFSCVIIVSADEEPYHRILYSLKTDKAPNLEKIDESWGEPLIHVTNDLPEAKLYRYWEDHNKNIGADVWTMYVSSGEPILPDDSDFYFYARWDSKYLYLGFRSPDDTPSGCVNEWSGDGIQMWIKHRNGIEDPYEHYFQGMFMGYWTLGMDDYTVQRGEFAREIETFLEIEDGWLTATAKIAFTDIGIRKSDVADGLPLGLVALRISSVSPRDQGYAGYMMWGFEYVITVVLDDPEVENKPLETIAPKYGPPIYDENNPGETIPQEAKYGDEDDTDASVPNLDGVSSWAIEEVEAGIREELVPTELQQNYTYPVTRGQVAQMFINLLEKATGKTVDEIMADKGVTINENAFTDTTDKAVLAANALGIINGTGNGKFSPDGTLKRAQIAAIINRVAKVMGVETTGYTHEFTDITDNYKWADFELGWPVYAGIVNGVGGGKFNPGGDLTTEQAILITYRGLSALKK